MKAYNLETALLNPDLTTELYIHNRGIEIIPNQIFSLKNLKVLSLTKNRISNIPKAISQLRNLSVIDFSSNALQNIPLFMELSKLRELKLSENNLSQFDCSLLGKNIRRIDISKNRIKKITISAPLPNLIFLDLSRNSIREFPIDIYLCLNLTNLNISHNKISAIPQGLSKLSSLENLNLSNNNLEEIPTEAEHLIYLRQFDISRNRIKSEIDFRKLKSLKRINLSNNRINKFKIYPQLENINLSNNKIEIFEFTESDQLKELKLSSNPIYKFRGSIDELSRIKILDLRRTKFREFPRQILYHRSLEIILGLNNFIGDSSKNTLLQLNKWVRINNISKNLHDKFVDIYMVSKPKLELTNPEIQIGLNCPFRKIREFCKTLRALDSIPFNQNPINKSSVILFQRKSFKHKNFILKRLSLANISYDFEYSKKTSHFCSIGKAAVSKLDYSLISIVSPKEMLLALEEHIKNIKDNRLDYKMVNKLLISRKSVNHKLALNMIDNGKMSEHIKHSLDIAIQLAAPKEKERINFILKTYF